MSRSRLPLALPGAMSAAVLAAVLAHRGLFEGRQVGIILSGGNVDLDALPALFGLAREAQP